MKYSTTSQAGGQNWLHIWQQMYDAERAQAEAVTAADFVHSPDHWATRAARFAAASRRVAQPDTFVQAMLPLLRPDDTVLDIGAGSGRYVPVLARHVARVIAVEPSAAMQHYLDQRIQDEELTNVQVVDEAWPPDTPLVADVAFSAHVLYSVREIGPFLQAMHAAARRLCVLFLMVRHMNTYFSPFWERFHHQPRLPLPAGLEAFNALYQLGYNATLTPVKAHFFAYADLNEALADIRLRLRMSPHTPPDSELTAAIQEMLVYNEDGTLSPPFQSPYAAVLWWETGTDR